MPDLTLFDLKNTNTPPKEISVKHDSSKPINEVLSTILLSRAQREERLKKRAVKLCEDPDKFVTITEKDKHDSLTFWNRMEIDSQMCAWTIELENDSKEHMDMMIKTPQSLDKGELFIFFKLNFLRIVYTKQSRYNQISYILLNNNNMAGIATRYVTENELNTEISIEELSKYAPALNILLTDKVKKDHT
ncbi:hypothetical protein RclHR1_16500006 [Rhizophagus clarus]|uniref:Uncharacterized protein n=1 Tax=Rhizophagus clarus TaxID=94130 RepID=A0A2Z6QYG1_9GLOM|nr:hypothetical protein RclHR1_16500006 [Rhizophagus clarus]